MRTLFVGDIHGCAEEFAHLLGDVAYRQGDDRLLLTGDAFSRGPDPLAVWRAIQETGAEMVLGNHDFRLREHLRLVVAGRADEITRPHQRETLDHLQPVTREVLAWLETLPCFIDDAAFLLVHAGVNPERGLEGTSRDEFLAIRTWPPNGTTVGPRWHDRYPPDGRLVVFGHDAPGGLVEKRRPDGSPYVIGLDSGCVYGNQLSAWILEEDRIVQVPSRQPPLFRDTDDTRPPE